MSPQREMVLTVVKRVVDSGRGWVKLTAPYLGSQRGPPTYHDAGLVVADLVRLGPERMLWAPTGPIRRINSIFAMTQCSSIDFSSGFRTRLTGNGSSWITRKSFTGSRAGLMDRKS